MTPILGSAVAEVAAKTIDTARPHAAEALGMRRRRSGLRRRRVLVGKTNHSITIEDLALRLVPDKGRTRSTSSISTRPTGRPIHGCHVVELEVDPGTCKVDLLRYTVVDDFGAVINPMTLEGQVHGGIAQGIGQAIYEYAAFDEQGQLVAGSLMDYAAARRRSAAL